MLFSVDFHGVGLTADGAAQAMCDPLCGYQLPQDGRAVRRVALDDGRVWQTLDTEGHTIIMSPALTLAENVTLAMVARALRSAGMETPDGCGLWLAIPVGRETGERLPAWGEWAAPHMRAGLGVERFEITVKRDDVRGRDIANVNYLPATLHGARLMSLVRLGISLVNKATAGRAPVKAPATFSDLLTALGADPRLVGRTRGVVG
jgi:hypothetical protein